MTDASLSDIVYRQAMERAAYASVDDTRTTVPSQIAAGALTSHPTPKPRTVSTTHTTGTLDLRYIPRPTPAPDVLTDTPQFTPQVDDRVAIRPGPGVAGDGLCGTVAERYLDGYGRGVAIVRLDNGITNAWLTSALEPEPEPEPTDDWPEDDARWVSEYPGLPRTAPFIPHAAGCKIGDVVDVRHGWFLAGRRGVIVSYDRDRDEFGVQFSSDGQKYIYSVHALEPVDTKSLLPCPGPASVVPRPGPDTPIAQSDYHIARLRTIVGLATAASRDSNKLTMATIVSLAESIVSDLAEGNVVEQRELVCFPV